MTDGKVALRLEDGRGREMRRDDPQLRHIDRAWASTAHAFQGRTVDTVIAAMEANHPHLTTQKTFYVEISRACHRAELVTDDRGALGERLEAVTGERVAVLEAIEPERGKAVEAGADKTRERERGPSVQEARPPIPKAVPQVPEREQAPRERKPEPEKVREGPELELDLGL